MKHFFSTQNGRISRYTEIFSHFGEVKNARSKRNRIFRKVKILLFTYLHIMFTYLILLCHILTSNSNSL
ncbi:hypothetical protein BGP_4697 [Beggiatoa sp. PS]|nr:hypothetical protein BGP_4697 [Beggiatoa sp. PS]